MKVIALALLMGLSASCSSGKVSPPVRSKTDDANPKPPPEVPGTPTIPTAPVVPEVPVTPVVAGTPKPPEYVPIHKISAALLAPPSSIPELSRSQMHSLIDHYDFLATERVASDDFGEGEPEACIEADKKLIGKVQGGKYIIDVSIDLMPCYKAYNDFGVVYKKAESKIYIEYSCDGVDLSAMDGTLLKDFDCKSGANQLMQTQTSYELEYSVYDEEEAEGEEPIARLEKESVTTYESMATASLEACRIERKGQESSASGCELIRKVVTTLPVASESYVKLVHKDLKWVESKEDTWYGSGAIAVQVNNWKGTVNYKGALLDPEQSLSDGTVTVKDFLPSLNEFENPIPEEGDELFLARAVKTVEKEKQKAKFAVERPKRSKP